MDKMLVILGPTAVGKTSLALFFARELEAELISADSRQVYSGLDIGTGKDIPGGFEKKFSNILWQGRKLTYYEGEKTKIWGYDLVGPKEEFSISHWLSFSTKVISDIKKRNLLPIIVGGTGFYVRALTRGYESVHIPRNKKLRQKLNEKSPEELFSYLVQINPARAKVMNESDKKNPRRLVRAIEITKSKIDSQKNPTLSDDILMIGLKAPRDFIAKKIEKRVQKRLKEGLLHEIETLHKIGVRWQDQSMQALGYRQWRQYFDSKKSETVFEKCKQEWIKEEKKYAKRQMTWFKKNKDIDWFDISDKNWRQAVEEKVKRWYSKLN